MCIYFNSEYQDKKLKEKERADSLWIWSEAEGRFVIDTTRWYWDKDRTGYYEIKTGLPLYLDNRHRKEVKPWPESSNK
jgi:hypothetical protein